MFDRLGEWVGRWWAIIIALWVGLLVVLELTAPRWDQITHDGDLDYLPTHYTSVRGQELMREAFPRDFLSSTVVIVAYRRPDTPGSEPQSLRPEDFAFVDHLFERLVQLWHRDEFLSKRIIRIRSSTRAEPPSAIATVDVDALIGRRLTSEVTSSGQATLLIASLDTEFLEVRNVTIVRRVRETIEEAQRSGNVPAGLHLEITGPAAIGHDLLEAAGESVRRTTWTTIAMVTLILLVVYRAPVLALIPLVTIGVAVRTSLHLVALLTQVPGLGFQIFKTTDIFIVVVLFGAGTDYCLFLLARYKEELEKCGSVTEALRQAMGRVGGALTASAGTVICGLSMMMVGEFGKFRYSGVAIALSLAVALCAALTLAPALLRPVGAAVFWPRWMQARRSQGWWDTMSHWLLARPGLIWTGSVAVLLPLVIVGTHPEITYDLLSELSGSWGSVRGVEVIRRYFPAGETSPVTVLLDGRDGDAGAFDFRTTEGRQAIAELTKQLRQLEWESPHGSGQVAEVRSLTSPLGSANGKGLGETLQIAAAQAFAMEYYVSSQPGFEGQVTRIDVAFDKEPFSKASLAGLERLNEVIRSSLDRSDSSLTGMEYALAGVTAATSDLRTVTISDQWRIYPLVAFGVFLILVLLLRRPGICLYLVASVVFGYLVTLGATELVFRGLYGSEFVGLDWKVPLFLFVILVAVGEDYNIFLMSRVKEEQAEHGNREGMRLALARTGGIISSCGLIMAGTFASMMTGRLSAMLELGFALAFGVLLDTFVVRPILVPAFVLMVEQWSPRVHHPLPSSATKAENRRIL